MTELEFYYTTLLFDLQVARYTVENGALGAYPRTLRTMVRLLDEYYKDTVEIPYNELIETIYNDLDKEFQYIIDWLIEIGEWEPYNR